MPGAHLADVAPADEQLVRDRLGVGGCVAQRRDEEGGLALEHGIPRLVETRDAAGRTLSDEARRAVVGALDASG